MINSDINTLDKRVIRTRKLLLDAFIALVAEKDFQHITVQDITERAMINRATFYAHFADKYALFDYTIQVTFHDHVEQSMPKADRLTHDNLRALTLATLTFLTQFMGHCAPSMRNDALPFEKQIQIYLYDVLVHWLEQVEPTTVPDNLSIDVIATMTSSAILGSALHHAKGNNSLSQEAYVDQMLTILTSGVCMFARQ